MAGSRDERNRLEAQLVSLQEEQGALSQQSTDAEDEARRLQGRLVEAEAERTRLNAQVAQAEAQLRGLEARAAAAAAAAAVPPAERGGGGGSGLPSPRWVPGPHMRRTGGSVASDSVVAPSELMPLANKSLVALQMVQNFWAMSYRLETFLQDIGLEQYTVLLGGIDVTPLLLAGMSDDELRSLGVETVGG